MKIYKSEKGYALYILAVVMILFFFGLTYSEDAPPEMYLIFTGIGGLFLGFLIYFNLSTAYIIDGQNLIVKCGWYTKSIAINTVKSISKTSILLSSPAPSFDRIELIYNKFDSLVISPKNKTNFAEDLLKINPKIENKLSSD